MIDIKKVKEDRYKFLYRVYEISNGQGTTIVDGWELGKELEFDKDYSTGIYYYLNEEGLTEPMGAGIRLAITHLGIKEIEESLENPDKSTEHFLPFNNYTINIETMNGGAIQQASNNSTINYTVSNEMVEAINSFLVELKDILPSLNLTQDKKEELETDIQTIEVQNKSKKPKRQVIKPLLASFKTVLEKASGSVLANVSTPTIIKLVEKAGQMINSLS